MNRVASAYLLDPPIPNSSNALNGLNRWNGWNVFFRFG